MDPRDKGDQEATMILAGVGVVDASQHPDVVLMGKHGKKSKATKPGLKVYQGCGSYNPGTGKFDDYSFGEAGTNGYTAKTYAAHPAHRGTPIKVGGYEILVGGMRDLQAADLDKADILVPLTQDIPNLTFGRPYIVLAAPLVDYGGVPDNWQEFLEESIIPLIKGGKKLLAYCVGSHGRTGTFVASLIALMETKEETPDPIAATRKRHCYKCVESRKQAEAIFKLRGEVLPKEYDDEFSSKWVTSGYNYNYSAVSSSPCMALSDRQWWEQNWGY